ncbi:tRNA (mnm(5)s(2)U34)-methyltransferase [Caldisalinibacter kiritimatiensis]|uniref:SAM-dependent methyltransferase, MraW methylase family n=1 Tax=Caldisalinibacter kiritimatiensis TaxID=1304284 RepID=R1CFL3_9FIRM|nr:class I SAM-dependent methyltransferase [Caldisalinibacter kiritimatiensis]EOD01090.1 SAM-dependent methyltransferase, MraW methylase family [Caldisalinibacter kiritimatiensis]
MSNMLFKNAVKISHDIIKQKIANENIVLDATVGNGNDTAFLAKLVGDNGKVYGFDIQKIAIKKAKEKLKSLDLLNRVVLINDGHENIDKYITEKIDLVVFNLGYLPGGDHSIITKPETTIEATKKALKMLNSKGLIIIVVYSGHKGGMEEKNDIAKFVKELNQTKYTVIKLDFMNQINNPPSLICIEKK